MSLAFIPPRVDGLRETISEQRPADVDFVGVCVAYGRGQEIYGEGEPADHIYKVLSGVVRGFKVLADGRRQISEFYLPGDCFGFEAGAEHRENVEAIVPSQVVVAHRASLVTASLRTDTVRGLWHIAIDNLQRSQDHVLMLGRHSAVERLASFLADLAERLGADDAFDLPMSRQDMADYLGLTIETVSRTLTQLQADGLIDICGCRKVRLRNRAALATLCQ